MVNEIRPTVSLPPMEQEALEIQLESISQQYAILPHQLQQLFIALQIWNLENNCGIMPAMKTLVTLICEISDCECTTDSDERSRRKAQANHLKALYDFLHSVAQAQCLP